MNWIFKLCTIALAQCWFVNAHAIPVLMSGDVFDDMQTFLAGRQPEDIERFFGPGMRRDVAEAIILVQAARLGGYSDPIDLISDQNTPEHRTKQITAQSDVVALAQPVWETLDPEFADDLTISAPLLDEGEFIVGIYVNENHPYTQAKPTLEEVKSLTFTVSATWRRDIDVIEHVGWPHSTTVNWVAMLEMLAQNKADAILAPFQPGDEMALVTPNLTLRPVLGYTVSFKGSRHFAISKHHPESEGFKSALDAGLIQLKAEGRLRQIYVEAGFFNDSIFEWTNLVQ
ncbi:MAG: hypothetical protein HWE20_10525 [Gammaproteobacteria bacterium]|nr:hypothetical protein [Gammaproteobacteria bacterium]